jgi:hemerythrin
MALIKWKDSFSVNVAEIDAQHQTLVDMINSLFDAMQRGEGKKVLGDIVNGLIDYTATHFTVEENYFDQFGYSETASHKQEHADFVHKVSEFKSDFEQGKVLMSPAVINFLSDWLQNHIAGSDKQYAQFFNDKGLK